ncbi:MAG: O-antigen ligase family protein [Chloroflexota bacterium]
MTLSQEVADAFVHGALALGIVAAGAAAAWWISRLTSWRPAGPIALIAATPLVPRLPIVASLTTDDLLPLVGLALLIWERPTVSVTADRLVRALLALLAVATLARIASALVNGGGLEGSFLMLIQAAARPLVLVGLGVYAALTAPADRRTLAVATALGIVATLEALFGLFAFLVPLPGDAGIEASRHLTSLYGVCRGRISGTLGLSPNHVGAVFVLSMPLTLALANRAVGYWKRWAWVLAAAVQGAALFLTFTRSSIYIGAVLVLALLLYRRMFKEMLALALVVAVTVFGIFSIGCARSGGPGTPGDPGAVLGGRLGDETDRLALWYSASLIMIDNPIFGIGIGRMNDVVAANPQRYRDTPYGPATSSAHNTVLLAGAETGVVGAAAILGVNIILGLLALRIAWRGWKRGDVLLMGASLAVIGYLAQGMVNNLFTVPATSSVFALIVGAFAGAGGGADNRVEDAGEGEAMAARTESGMPGEHL